MTTNLVDIQVELEAKFNNNQLMSRMRKEFQNSGVPFDKAMEMAGIPEEFGYTLLTQMALHRQTTVEVLVPLMRRKADNDIAATIILLERSVVAGLVDYNPQRDRFIVKWLMTEEVQKELDIFQFPLPMVTEPKHLKDNLSSPYYTQSKASVILRDNHHDNDVCLDHLNRMNKVPLSINLNTATMIQNSWRNLDRCKEDESQRDYEKRVKAFEKYDLAAMDIMNSLTMITDRIYIPYSYDKRGRSYTKGYHVNPQGNAWNKAVINFADKEVTTG